VFRPVIKPRRFKHFEIFNKEINDYEKTIKSFTGAATGMPFVSLYLNSVSRPAHARSSATRLLTASIHRCGKWRSPTS
jgi:hypothetical protein